MERRSQFIAFTAGVMALILIIVLVYFYNKLTDAVPRIEPSTVDARSPTLARVSATLLPPPRFVTRPVPRAVVSIRESGPIVINFNGLRESFTGTWAAYPKLCENAWYEVSEKTIAMAGGQSCVVRGKVATQSLTSATVVLDCHHNDNDYEGREVWNISQPRPGSLNIRPHDINGGGNAISLIRCPAGPQIAAR